MVLIGMFDIQVFLINLSWGGVALVGGLAKKCPGSILETVSSDYHPGLGADYNSTSRAPYASRGGFKDQDSPPVMKC